MIVVIKYGKLKFELLVGEDGVENIGDMKDAIIAQTGGEFEKAYIRLIFSGRVLSDESTLSLLKIDKNNFKLTMVYSKPMETIPIHHLPRVKNDLIEPAPSEFKTKRMKGVLSKDSKFSRLETLPGLPMEEKAREILAILANEPDPVTILGLNENYGQRIFLRIRSDGLDGFRDLASIRKTLCHELAHNVYGDHDDNFYMLWRQIEREVAELDWRKSSGQSLSGVKHSELRINSSAWDADDAGVDSASGSRAAVIGGVYILGGGSHSSVGGGAGATAGSGSSDNADNFEGTVPASVLAGQAAMLRRTRQELEMSSRCGCSKDKDISNATAVPQDVEDAVAAHLRLVGPIKTVTTTSLSVDSVSNIGIQASGGADDGAQDVTSTAEGSDVFCLPCVQIDGDILSGGAEQEVAEEMTAVGNFATSMVPVSDNGNVESGFPSPVSWEVVCRSVLAVVDDSVAASLSADAAAPVEKIFGLRQAIEDMLTCGLIASAAHPPKKAAEQSADTSTEAAIVAESSGKKTTVKEEQYAAAPVSSVGLTDRQLEVVDAFVLLRTIVGNAREMPERREVNMKAKVFQRLLAPISGAVAVLSLGGFTQVADKLKLTRVDIALLYLVFEFLDTCIHAIDEAIFAA